MTLQNNTILITGGSSGLGLEMAKQFISLGNKVIVCSRTSEKLRQAQKTVPGIITYVCDISIEEERRKLSKWIEEHHPEINILINNAAIVHRIQFAEDAESYEKSAREIATNLQAPIHLCQLFLPLLAVNPNAKIINITTGLVYVPRTDYPFYNATKAALHSFTQVLRNQLKNNSIKVTEVLFPVVDTPWHEGNAPKIAITPHKAVNEMIKGLINGKNEIRVGKVRILYYLARLAPKFAFRKINSLR
ncbi:oxidoreductase [Flavobacterium sp. Leaf359]|uniref:SDR family oxidoreductase n=1 Tax=Flavobacterium sp. Leaf359 TaxID=1736351 RepID=UPI0006F56FDD|nr:SDR family NAD(P)-dependent oxidoreductase [Flavobacterium sp. Leaf359]KQS53474.1 oxidoreductase [Flavobacterium sp. Leaf359]